MPVPLDDPATVDIGRLRVLLQVTDGIADPTPDVERAVRDAAAALADAGARVTEGRLPPGGHELTERFWGVGGEDDTGAGVFRVLRDWDHYRSLMLRVLRQVDAILTPVAPHAAPPPGVEPTWRYTTPHSLTGWPCAVVRAGSSGPLPIGVQVVAGPWQDHVALAAAGLIERAMGGWQPPP